MSKLLKILYKVRENPQYLRDVVIDALNMINEKSDEIFSEEGLIFLKGIAKLAYEQKLYEIAEDFYDIALDVCRSLKGETSQDCAIIYNDAAMVQERKGNIVCARILYKRCLKILNSTLGPNHPFTKSVRHNLSSLK